MSRYHTKSKLCYHIYDLKIIIIKVATDAVTLIYSC